MASVPKRRRPGEVSVTLLSLSVPWPLTGSYGVRFSGNAPVSVSHVAPGSAAERAGVKVGDIIAKVNGQSTEYSTRDNVLSLVQYSQGSPLSLQVGRPFPIPVTGEEIQRALMVLVTQMHPWKSARKEVTDYSATIDEAFQEVQDILGALGGDQVVPDVQGGTQEITYSHDSDSLSSPPPSDDEGKGPVDPLLDFSLDDDLTHTPGLPPIQAEIEVGRGLRGMTSIIEGVRERQREKEKLQAERKERGMFSTEASMPVDRRRKGRDKVSPPPPPAQPTRTEAVQPVVPPPRQHTEEHPPLREPARPSPTREEWEPAPTRSKRPELQQELPPVPAYNPPGGKDSFPLSNRPGYREAWRKDIHEDVDSERVKDRSLSPPRKLKDEARKSASPPVRDAVRVRNTPSPQKEPVRLRIKKSKSPDRVPEVVASGYVADPGHKKKSFQPTPPDRKSSVTDVQDLTVACRGLPARVKEWRGEEVGLWLKQLSPTLYEFYFPCFSKHDITGRTLMRLNDTSLKSAGIDDPKHRRLLATMIMRLRIDQERREIQDMESRIERTLIN